MTARRAPRVSGAQVRAQAKVNLRLRILAREASGFHQLETLFLRLTLADTVRIRLTGAGRSLDVSGLTDAGSIGPVEQNLAWRAADAYFAAAGWSGGFAIELEKRIPIGGGLGGGSADGAGVLRALDAIAPEALGPAMLRDVAAGLGSDLPFLVGEHAYALAWGRGERMLALAPPPSRPVLLIVPPFGVSTAAAYGWLAESRGSGRADLHADILDLAALSTWATLAPLASNDFEPIVRARHAEIATITAALRRAGCPIAMMSGSGSTVFGIGPEDDDGPFGAEVGRAAAETTGLPARSIATATATHVEPIVPVD